MLEITKIEKNNDQKLYHLIMKNIHTFLKKAMKINDTKEFEVSLTIYIKEINKVIANLLGQLNEKTEIFVNISRRLKFIIVECFHTKTVLLCKYLLKQYFDVKIF